MGRPASTKRLIEADYPPEQRRLVQELNDFLTSTTGALGGALTFDNMNAVVREFTLTMPASGANPTLGGLWTTLYGPVGYSKGSDGIVRLSGTVSGGTYDASVPLFTLPTGYRPSFTRQFAVAQSSVAAPAGLVQVFTDGSVVAPPVVSMQSGTSTFLSLDGVSFEAALGSSGGSLAQNLSIGTLKAAKSLIVLSCYDVTDGSPVAAPYPQVAWQPVFTNGQPYAQITALNGLSGGRRYTLRVVIFA